MLLTCDNEVQSPFTPKAARLRRPFRAVVAYRRGGDFQNATMRKTKSVEERFWKYVKRCRGIKSQFVDSPCWEWSGTLNNKGYGNLTIDKVPVRAHRISWEIHHGKIPDRIRVLHKCDNPKCVNPYHLFLGTQKDNISDMWKKGRDNHARGERAWRAILTADNVREIKSELAKHIRGTAPKMAKKFNVHETTIRSIQYGISWKHMR